MAVLRWTKVKYALEDHGLVDEIRLTRMDWTLVRVMRAVRLQFGDQKPTDTKTDVKTLGIYERWNELGRQRECY